MLTFVSLTSPPALLYAIPVERFVAVDTARNINLIFLLAVAVWRVALLCFYLRRAWQMEFWEQLAATLLPLAIIMAPLSLFHLTNGVFQAMAGLRAESPAQDPVVPMVMMLGAASCFALIPLIILHRLLVVWRRDNPVPAASQS